MKTILKQITKKAWNASKKIKVKAPKRNFSKVTRNFRKNIKFTNAIKIKYFSTQSPKIAYKTAFMIGAAGTVLAASLYMGQIEAAEKVDYKALRSDIEELIESALEQEPMYDDGSFGPLLVRLAWHASGTYSKHDGTGGSTGGTIRFKPESEHGANAGLDLACKLLEPLKQKYPGITYADLYTYAGVVAIETMGGPKINWRPGRTDEPAPESVKPTPDDRLPDAAQGQTHLRDIFYRMGFNDQEIVALAGAHVLGRCHRNRSGYEGPWTRSPTSFTNAYFQQLTENKWTPKRWDGPFQYEDPTGELMMLPADIALIQDPKFKKYVEIYASDQDRFFKDFAKAFAKLLELGVKFPQAGGKGNGSTWANL